MMRNFLIAVMVVVIALGALAAITYLNTNNFDAQSVRVDGSYAMEHPEQQGLQAVVSRERWNLRRDEVLGLIVAAVAICALIGAIMALMRRCPSLPETSGEGGKSAEVIDEEARRLADEAWLHAQDARDQTASCVRSLRRRSERAEARLENQDAELRRAREQRETLADTAGGLAARLDEAERDLEAFAGFSRQNRDALREAWTGILDTGDRLTGVEEEIAGNRARFQAVGEEIGRNRAISNRQAEELRRVGGMAEDAGNNALRATARLDEAEPRIRTLGRIARDVYSREPGKNDERRARLRAELEEKFGGDD